MNKQLKNKAVSLVMILFFLILFVWCIIKPETSFSDSERRSLASFPQLTWETVISGRFMTDFETYSLDQFPLREEFRTIKAVTNQYVFGQKDNNGIYVKDGYAAQMEYPLNEASVSYAAKRFRYVYDKYLDGTETKVYLSIIPDKHYYLNEGERLSMDYEKLICQMREQTDYAEYIDITDTLSLDSFYKTDVHWRQEKLIPTAEKLGDAMGVSVSAAYKENTLDHDFCGVYYGQAALPLEAENMQYLTNDTLAGIKVYDYQNDKESVVYDMEKAAGKDPYEMFLSGSISLLTLENRQAEENRELIVFRDSFASSIVPLLAEGYQKITVVDIRYIHPDVLEKFVEFDAQDVLFLYSTLVLNNSEVLR